MIDRLARWIVGRAAAWTVVIVVLLAAIVGVALSTTIEQEDDLLAFLPADDPDVAHFQLLNRRFGGLDVALVGLEPGDVFAPEFLRRLQHVTRALGDTAGLDNVLSMTNVVDFTLDPVRGGVVTGPLVPRVPASEAERRALRAKVLALDHVVGNLVTADGEAALIYCFLAHGSDPKQVAARIRQVVGRTFDADRVYWGGGPFISTYIYNSTRVDMRRLTPWAVLAMVIVMMIAFRDVRGTCLALLSTTFGIVFSLGLMVVCGYRINLALSSMPVILFAVGSAYGIHILARYYALARTQPAVEAVVGTLRSAGPTVLAAGMTTVVSLFSFVAMDLQPLRVFGLFTAIGVLATLLLALTFIPAVIVLARFGGRRPAERSLGRRLMIALVLLARRRRLAVGLVFSLLTVAGIVLTLQIDARIELSKLFARGSPPDRAERFLRRRFGGSRLLQLHVAADLTDPAVLREAAWLGDRVALRDDVSSVMHLGQALSQANAAMEGLPRLPDTEAKARLLYAMLLGESSVGQLLTPDRRHALLHAKLASVDADAEDRTLGEIERWLAAEVPLRYRLASADEPGADLRRRARVTDRIAALLKSGGSPLPAARVAALRAALLKHRPVGPLPRPAVTEELTRFLRSEECVVEPREVQPDGSDPARVLARAIAALPPGVDEERLRRALVDAAPAAGVPADQVDDLLLSLVTPLDEIWQRQLGRQRAEALLRRLGITLAPGPRAKHQRQAIAAALLELDAPDRVLVPDPRGAVRIAVRASGLPVLHRSLSRSSLSNQLRSLGVALLPVIVIMALLFRSLRSGLLVASPTLFTLLLIYGGMGLLGIRLDIGTAMLACIILGAGVDYAVHLVAGWRGATPREAAIHAVRATGPAIWTNALMVAIGFGVLTMGHARPLQNVGGLTAVAMLVAAATTFLLIPLLARRRQYGGQLVNDSTARLVSMEVDPANGAQRPAEEIDRR